ncbi:MAG: hypothetical protein ABI663_10995 [Chryseolinea sp.]
MNEIQTLIQELEHEQAELKRLIDESVKTGEYLIAHFHSEALGYVNRRLQTLRNLDDKNFDSKKMIKSMIKRAHMQLGVERPEKFKDYIKKEIEKHEWELQELNQQGKVTALESQVLIGHLESLISNKIKGVRIFLIRSSNFILDIKKHRSGIKILVPNMKTLRKNYIMHDENIQHFYGLGFTADENESKLTLLITNRNREQLLKELQRILAKIVFEIFYFKEFAGDTFIEIRE